MTNGQCLWCGTIFRKKHNREMYCSEKCKQEARRKQINNAWRRWFHKNKSTLYKKQLGTRTIGPHPSQDIEEEHRIIQNEKRRLGL